MANRQKVWRLPRFWWLLSAVGLVCVAAGVFWQTFSYSALRTPAVTTWESGQHAQSLQLRTVSDTPPFVWWEAEAPTLTNFPPSDRNPFAPANAAEAALLSGDRWIGVEGNYSQPLFLEYRVTVSKSGTYFFYTRKFWRHGPFRWRWNEQPWSKVNSMAYLMDEVRLRSQVGMNWISLGKVTLAAGTHRLRIELTEASGAAAFDCFVLTQELLQPRGKLQPNQRYAVTLADGFGFDPDLDRFTSSPIDWRHLNEKFAGEHGYIRIKGSDFVHETTGQPVRFWAVNTTMRNIHMDTAEMDYLARFWAKKGVNMVRLHGSLWDEKNWRSLPPENIDHLFAFVAALKRQGIYTCLSIYFPLWLDLQATPEIPGYTGQKPFGLLFFNPAFQQVYYRWWRTILTTPNPYTGMALKDDPAVAMLELVNEDSLLFWTFDPYKTIPAAQMEGLEQRFGQWLARKYGSLEAMQKAWGIQSGQPMVMGDRPETGRVGFLTMAQVIAQSDTRRAQDTATFLAEVQQQFFQAAIAYLRTTLTYKGLIYASNWITANPRLLDPLDKASNTVADFMDRHGYFSSFHTGKRATYSLAPGHLYEDQSALLFTSQTRTQRYDFRSPVMDVQYNGMPSTITEVNWAMPNRFRADFPLVMGAYSLLQGTDGIFFFVADAAWDGALGKFPIASPVTLGQFPAMALVYRRGLIQLGDPVVKAALPLEDLQALRGAPVTAPQSLDELRAKDVPVGQSATSTIDPLAFLIGSVQVQFTNGDRRFYQADLSAHLDHPRETVRSSTGQLTWNYGKGLLSINAPQVQGATGFLRHAGQIALGDVTFTSPMDYGTILLVALDDRPVSTSRRLLLQVMSEDQNFGWRTQGFPRKTVESVGNPPIVVRNLAGQISLRSAQPVTVTPLDANGYPVRSLGVTTTITLQPNTFYYLLER